MFSDEMNLLKVVALNLIVPKMVLESSLDST